MSCPSHLQSNLLRCPMMLQNLPLLIADVILTLEDDTLDMDDPTPLGAEVEIQELSTFNNLELWQLSNMIP